MIDRKPASRGTEGPGGFTLVEVMVAVAIFSIIMVAISMVFISGTRTYRQSVHLAQMRILTQRTLGDLRGELTDARFIDGANLLDQINFQRPTPRENAQGELRYLNTGTHEPFWGDGETEVDGSGETHVRNTLRFQFVLDDTLDETLDGADYNRDGDRDDVFERGRIVRMVIAQDGTELGRRALTHDWVFKPALPRPVPPDLMATEYSALQVDNLGSPDPLFLILDDDGNPDPAGGRVQIVLFHMKVLDGTPLLVRSETVITPVNK